MATTAAPITEKGKGLSNWHSLSVNACLNALDSSPQGLSLSEVEKRQERYGKNEITWEEGPKWTKILISQFANVMVLILGVGSLVSLLLEEYLEAIAILVILLLNAAVGFIQEYKAEKAVEALKALAAPKATVLRHGEVLKIPAEDLVAGDILILEEGMNIPADARLMEVAQLSTIESSLTGESTSTEKHTDPIEAFDSLGDLKNMVFMGTVVSKGHGKAVVVEIGMKTSFGHIAHLVQSAEDEATPLQKEMNTLSMRLALGVVVIIALLFLFAFATGRDLVEMFLLSVSLAVSVIPEGLPAVITLTLALGVQKMAKKNAIVRKLTAAETLGSTSVICTDKTGTLTQNQMTVERLVVGLNELDVSGKGYIPEGDFLENGKLIDPRKNKDLMELLRIGVLCNNSELHFENEKWELTGDPTEACLLTVTEKAGLNHKKLHKDSPRKGELIFDSKRKAMSTWDGQEMHTKGAPDYILEHCTHILDKGKVRKLTHEDKAKILKLNEELAKKAYRVLAFAKKEVRKKAQFTEEELTFVGLMGMMDPPREEVKAALKQCKKAHIEVKMITGDHALTAKAIGESIGLSKEGDLVITGSELEKMSDEQLSKQMKHIKIFARVSPDHKLRILKTLQAQGLIVAMTGDGVNDAPALKGADIGVAMGITGSDIAKEASQIILTDDNFASIVSSVENGRVIYRNIKKFIRFLLSANVYEILVISIVYLLGFPLPLLPLQILWVNLLTDALPAIALGVDHGDPDIMKIQPRNPKQSIWKELILFSLIAGALATSFSLFLFFRSLDHDSLTYTRSLIFTTLVVFEMILVFSARFEAKHYFTEFFSNRLLWLGIASSIGLQLLALHLPFFQNVLETTPVRLTDWLWIIGLSALSIAVIEAWKHFRPQAKHV